MPLRRCADATPRDAASHAIRYFAFFMRCFRHRYAAALHDTAPGTANAAIHAILRYIVLPPRLTPHISPRLLRCQLRHILFCFDADAAIFAADDVCRQLRFRRYCLPGLAWLYCH